MTRTQADTRAATISDATGIAELMSDLGYPCTTDQMQKRLMALANDPAYVTFVATIDESLVGMIGAFVCRIYEQDKPIGRIIALSVNDRFRGIGIGRSLVQTAEQWIVARGASAVLVNSGNDRLDAHKFYERTGYSVKGVSFVRHL